MKILSLVLTMVLTFTASVLSAQSYDSEVISVERFTGTIKRTGRLDYKRTLNISFQNSGYLTVLNVDEGERFTKGQLLASLDVTELIEQKNSQYAQLMQAKREVKRISSLMAKKLASERDLDIANTNVETTRSAFQITNYNLEKAQINADFSGIVLKRNAELGELQRPGVTALTVAKLDWIVKIALTDREISQVQLNQKVKVALNKMGTVEGVISKIPAIANADSNLFTVEVSLPAIKLTSAMIAGQFANVSIGFESNKFVYRLPIAALVAVDASGKAIVLAQLAEDATYRQLSFDVLQLDNDYAYLNADQYDLSLRVMTDGWQNYSMTNE